MHRGALCMECTSNGTGKSACATISRPVQEGFLHRFRVSINHRQVGATALSERLRPCCHSGSGRGPNGVAQTAAFAVCGFSPASRSRTQGHPPVFEICGFPYGRTADPKDGGPRYPNAFARGASMHRTPHQPGQPLCHRVPSVAGSGFCSTGTPACAPGRGCRQRKPVLSATFLRASGTNRGPAKQAGAAVLMYSGG